jgi:hypothetical protein
MGPVVSPPADLYKRHAPRRLSWDGFAIIVDASKPALAFDFDLSP